VRLYKERDPTVAFSGLFRATQGGRYAPLEMGGEKISSDLESITVTAGESLTISAPSVAKGLPLNLRVCFVSADSPDTIWTTVHTINAVFDDQVLWGLAVAGGGPDVRILCIHVEELGNLTTPFFQVVSCTPQGDVDDVTAQLTALKYDTNSPAFPGRFLSDVALLPAGGIPAVALSDASAGSPKGLSYLHTKDFQGPNYSIVFPEYDVGGPGLRSDNFPLCQRRKCFSVIDYVAPIYVRPGESIGIVSSAELATAGTAVPISGWMPFEIGVDVTVEYEVTPSITFTGLQAGTKIALVETGTETLVEMLTESGGVASYTHDATGPDLDARILAAGYVFQQIDGIAQDETAQTFPIQQVADEIYDSGWSEALTFNGSTHRINVDSGNTSINVPYMYSAWVDWALTGNNLAYEHAFENQGGTVIDPGEGTYIPAYCYLVNSWRVKPQEADHTLSVKAGVLLVSGGGDPFVDTTGAYTVRINYQQPVQAITVSTGGVTPADVADAVWDEAVADHDTQGTTGWQLQRNRGTRV
jgi:hypothetical protein